MPLHDAGLPPADAGPVDSSIADSGETDAEAADSVPFLTDPKVLTKILDHLKLPAAPPALAGSGLLAAEDLFEAAPTFDETEPAWAWDETDAAPPAARGPSHY